MKAHVQSLPLQGWFPREVRSVGCLGDSITENGEEQGIVQCLLQSVCRVWAVSYMEHFCIEVMCWVCKAMLFSALVCFFPGKAVRELKFLVLLWNCEKQYHAFTSAAADLFRH